MALPVFLFAQRESSALRRGLLLSRNKSNQKSAKGTPLGIPVLRGRICFRRGFILRHAVIGKILRLPRSPATLCSFGSLPSLHRCALRRRKKRTSYCHSRHSKGNAPCNFLPAGAGERGKRFAFSMIKCRKLYRTRNIGGPRKKFGDFKGCPLNAFCTLLCGQKCAAGGKTNHR